MRTSLLILGAFAIAYNLANLLHELGHALAVCLSGGRVANIILNPFSWNWTICEVNPSPLFVAWSGVAFGVIFAVALAAAALFIRSPYLAPLYLLAGCALAMNGIYLAVAAIGDVGDAGTLVRFGVPRAYVVGIGLVLLVASCVCSSLVQGLIGIPSDVPLGRRLFALHAGITPYLIVMVVYVLLFAKDAAPIFVAFAAAGGIAVTAIAVSGHLLRGFAGTFSRLAYLEPTWASSITVFALGAALVAGELVRYWSE